MTRDDLEVAFKVMTLGDVEAVGLGAEGGQMFLSDPSGEANTPGAVEGPQLQVPPLFVTCDQGRFYEAKVSSGKADHSEVGRPSGLQDCIF